MKKVLSILLTLCMLSTILLSVPLSAGAAEVSEDIAATGSEDGKVLYVFGDSIAEGFLENSNYVDSWVKYVIDINGYKKDPNGFYKRKQQEAAELLSVSQSYFLKIYRACFGTSCAHDIQHSKLAYAKKLLLQTDMILQDIAERCGYDYSHFMRLFKKEVGMTPTAYRKGASR